ncbi:hypothetical protein SCOCK_610039 [Actinacidiphila cocklensis]|uniref:Uncharacterized protein n=1 Tax=Actinacidiphila cocklensis TaxID=887465 RepID=A0A9W4EAZ6_9ACTN|nr:hypothetical protein SCOCK_610039 [Actinacidiphila cocklensis]
MTAGEFRLSVPRGWHRHRNGLMLALTQLVDPQQAAPGDASPHPLSPQHVGGLPAPSQASQATDR